MSLAEAAGTFLFISEHYMVNMLTLDYETYYAVKYSLTQLGVINYVRDPRFKAHGLGAKHNFDPAYWVSHDDIPEWMAEQDWENTFLICHNTPFDGFINTEVYNCPHRVITYADTLSMARAVFPPGMKLDLNNVARVLFGGGKIDGLSDTKGKETLDDWEEAHLAHYCINDVEETFKVFMALYPCLPQPELDLLDMHLRMACEPELEIDRPLAQRAYDEEVEIQRAAVADAGVAKTVLSSNPQFQKYLEGQGVKVPMKTSAKTGKETPCFSQNDLPFKTMMADHPELAKVWKGRLAAKSNIGISRAKRWLDIHDMGKGTLPMPLKYYGAHTGRSSGADGINVQNLPRINKSDKESGKLRKSIIAPEGYRIVVSDSSQIEMRVNMWLAGQDDMLDIFRTGKDPYSHTATNHFGYEVTKKMPERQFGKMLSLALGFGMGHVKFRANGALGFMGCPAVSMTAMEAQGAVNLFRQTNSHVKDMWDYLTKTIIPAMAYADNKGSYKCLEFGHEEIILPNGMALQYPNMHATEDGWVSGVGRELKRLYGGILDENIVQALARIIVFYQMLEIDRTEGIHVVSSTHDEVIALVRESEADDALEFMNGILRIKPTWALDLPLDSEGGHAREYSK